MYSEQKRWATLSRLTRGCGYFWLAPEITSHEGMTFITEHWGKYPVLLIYGFLPLGMAIVSIVAPWIAHYSNAWLKYLETHEKIRACYLALIVLTVVCGVGVVMELFRKAKIVLDPATNQIRFRYGWYPFTQKFILQRGCFRPDVHAGRQFFRSSRTFVLRPVDQLRYAIELFSLSQQRHLHFYEMFMMFVLGRLPDDLATVYALSNGTSVTFSKAPLFQPGPVTRPLKFSSPTADRIVFQRSVAESVIEVIVSLLCLTQGLAYSIMARGWSPLIITSVVALPLIVHAFLDLRYGFHFRGVTIDKTKRTVVLASHRFYQRSRTETYSFDEIVAIQICRQRKPGILEVNLILASGYNKRVTLAISTDRKEIRQQIKTLAEFMELPVVDHSQVDQKILNTTGDAYGCPA